MSQDNGNEPPVNEEPMPIEAFTESANKFAELSQTFFRLFLQMEENTRAAAQQCIDMANLLDNINKKIEGARNE